MLTGMTTCDRVAGKTAFAPSQGSLEPGTSSYPPKACTKGSFGYCICDIIAQYLCRGRRSALCTNSAWLAPTQKSSTKRYHQKTAGAKRWSQASKSHPEQLAEPALALGRKPQGIHQAWQPMNPKPAIHLAVHSTLHSGLCSQP